MKAVLGWLARTGMTFVLLFLAVAFYALAWPTVRAQLGSDALRQDAMSVEAMRLELAEFREDRQRAVDAQYAEAKDESAAAIRSRLAAARSALADKERQRAPDEGWLDGIRPSRILAARKREIEIAALRIEVAALANALEMASTREKLRQDSGSLERLGKVPKESEVRRAARECALAEARLAEFRSKSAIEQMAENIWREKERTLVDRRRWCDTAERWKTERERGIALATSVRDLRANLDGLNAYRPERMVDDAAAPARATVRELATRAAWLLALLLAMPFVIRLLCWFVLAPLAERSADIRVAVPGGPGTRISASRPSATSVAVTIDRDEELLVRRNYLQSSPLHGTKATRWFLDWRHPLSSLASGMWFLTMVRGDGTTTTISAAHDPFAEVSLLHLPAGSATVLHPQALAAVAQPRGRPLRIASHWRLFTLNAWLTLQLRYLVFHGPARLVVKGGRGIRAEPAERGRIFGQDQLVGFSGDLAYAVRRNETFWPYFLGQESLLRDRVSGGTGLLLVEEAPLAGRKGKGLRGGIEGAIDSLLKAVGI